MARIDFIGATGVGKSTLYQALLCSTKSKRQWLTVREAETAIATQFLENRGTATAGIALAAMKFSFLRRRVANSVFNAPHRGGAWETPEKWGRFLQQAHQFTADDPLESLRIHVGHFRLWQRVQEVAVAEFYLGDQAIVYEESIYHATLPIVAPSTQCRASTTCQRLYESLPLPIAVVHVTAPQDVICDRLLNRESAKESRILSIRALDTREIPDRINIQLVAIQVAVDVIRKAGIPVFTIDVSEDSVSQIQQLASFLEKVGGVAGNSHDEHS